jgi:hypothetical protein
MEDRVAKEHEWMLQSEEMRSRIIGVDEKGEPLLCGTREEDLRPTPPASRSQQLSGGEEEFVAWELVPGVVPLDGSESFYVKARVNTDGIDHPFLEIEEAPFNPEPIKPPEGESKDHVLLRDDGEGNDEIEGDSVYTSKSLEVDTAGTYRGGAEPYAEFRSEDLFAHGLKVVVEKVDGTTEEAGSAELIMMSTGSHDQGTINSLDSVQVSAYIQS